MGKSKDQLKCISARIDEAALACSLTIEPGLEPGPAAVALCMGSLTDLGIPVNARHQAIVEEGLRHFALQPDRAHRIEICGKPPVDGTDGWFEWAPEFDPSRCRKGEIPEDGRAIDYYSQSRFICVQAGTVLGTLHPPTDGADGINLLGLNVPAKPGAPARLTYDSTIIANQNGELVTAVAGTIEFNGENLRIAQELDIKGSVDFGTGNIDFDGNVVVRGAIRDNFRVRVTGDLQVIDVIEAAQVQTGRDLFIGAGVTGRERATVTVGRNCTARYANQAKMRVKRDLKIQREMINCDAQVGGSLSIPGGDLIGGRVHVLGTISLGSLGSKAGIGTTVHLGSSPKLQQQFAHAEKERNGLAGRLARIEDESAGLRQQAGRMDNATKERLTELGMMQTATAARLAHVDQLIGRIADGYALLRKIELRVKDAIYPGVRLVVGDKVADLNCGVRGPVCVTEDADGRLVVRDDAGGCQPLSAFAKVYDAAEREAA